MPFFKERAALLVLGALLALAGCGEGSAVPSAAGAGGQVSSLERTPASLADTTSILKLLKKDVTIGSTVDQGNGDTGPRAVTVIEASYGPLKRGQVLVCNFDDTSGNAGKGTTIELFSPPSSKPKTFVQSSEIEGCNGSAITGGEQVYGTGLTSKTMAWISQNGKIQKKYGPPVTDPIGDSDAPPLYLYSPELIWVGNADTGNVDNLSLGGYGTGKVLEVISGFDVNNGSGWSALGPSGFAYDCGALPGSTICQNHNDVLYVADGACNTIVSISHASSLLTKDEIVVQPGCKSFKCLYPKTSCGKVVKSGKPLNAPVAMVILPNGNLIVANTKGGNKLVELTPAGKVLATKVIDKSKTPGIYGLAAIGTKDSNTALYYTDTNTNTLHELEQ